MNSGLKQQNKVHLMKKNKWTFLFWHRSKNIKNNNILSHIIFIDRSLHTTKNLKTSRVQFCLDDHVFLEIRISQLVRSNLWGLDYLLGQTAFLADDGTYVSFSETTLQNKTNRESINKMEDERVQQPERPSNCVTTQMEGVKS